MQRFVPHPTKPDLGVWHPWFAWRPVSVPMRVGTMRVWLETIYRRGKYVNDGYDRRWAWEYCLDNPDDPQLRNPR